MANGMMTTIRYDGVQPVVGGMEGHDHTAMSGSVAPTTGAAPGPAAAHVDAAAVTAVHRVSMTDNRYTPAALTVPVGATVAFVNNGTNLHTTSAFDLSFDSGAVPTGKAWTITFEKPGRYQYFCRQHFLNGMAGVVTVQ